MIFSFAFLIMFLIPVVVLCWRVVVTKSRKMWRRVGAAGAAMISAVGAFVVFDDVTNFAFSDWRADVALVASMSASLYLLAWARSHRGNRRHRTISVIAAIVGLVPVIGTVFTALLLGS